MLNSHGTLDLVYGTNITLPNLSISLSIRNSKETIGSSIVLFRDKSKSTHTGYSKDVESLLFQLEQSGVRVELWALTADPKKVLKKWASSPAYLKHISRAIKSKAVIISLSGNSAGRFAHFFSRKVNKNVSIRTHHSQTPHAFSYLRKDFSTANLVRVREAVLDDFRCVIYAKVLFCISPKDANYYRLLSVISSRGQCRPSIFTLPYLPIRSSLTPEVRKESHTLKFLRSSKIVALGTPATSSLPNFPDRLFIKSIREDLQLARALIYVGYGITSPIPGLENLSYVDDVSFEKVLRDHEKFVVPTSFGSGFKTKIADLIVANKIVFINHKLLSTVPLVYRDFVHPINDYSELTQMIQKRGLVKTSFDYSSALFENLKVLKLALNFEFGQQANA